jgi:hypothetical protein
MQYALYYFQSIFFHNIFRKILGRIAHNVPVVYDVFAVAIKELRSNSSNRKNVAEKSRTKAVGRLRVFVARAAYWRRSIYNPVMCRFFALINFLFLETIVTVPGFLTLRKQKPNFFRFQLHQQ